MEKKLLFIFNPKSGKGQIRNKLVDIIDIFVKNGYTVITHPTQAPLDGRMVAKRMMDQVDMIVCSGGDGTLDEIVTGLMQAKSSTPLGYIPSGSTNDFAVSLNIPKDMLEAAEDIMHGQVMPQDVGTFNDDVFVYIAAFGLFTDVSYQTSQNLKNILGHLAYVMEGVKRIFDVRSYRLKVEANGRIYEGEYIYGMVTNSHSVGGFKNLTAPDVEMNDGLFEVMLIKKPKNPLELNEILAALVSEYDHTDMIDSFKSDSIVIQAEEQIAWTRDGEYGGEHSYVKIENKKQALNIIIRG